METKKINIEKDIILKEIDAKNAAIEAYNRVIWRVRMGFLTLTFAGWSYVLKGAIEKGELIDEIKIYIFFLLLLSIALSIGGFIIDINFFMRKLRVTYFLNELQKKLINRDIDLDDLSPDNRKLLSPYIELVGDFGKNKFGYTSKGFLRELMVSAIIFLPILIGSFWLILKLRPIVTF